ncbi:hypothetical protein [Streptomyces sp. NPDC003730]
MSALLVSSRPTTGTRERAVVTALITEPEAPVSDAPAYAPQCLGALLLMLSPKLPKEPKER